MTGSSAGGPACVEMSGSGSSVTGMHVPASDQDVPVAPAAEPEPVDSDTAETEPDEGDLPLSA